MRLHSIKFFAMSVLVTFALLTQANIAMAAATAPPLGTAQSFAILGGSAITNTGPTIIHGNMGLSAGTSITGFPPGSVVPPGTIHVADPVAVLAKNDATIAYNALASQACDFGPIGTTDLAGQTLAPGVHCYSSSVQNSGVVTLNGTANDIWVFKIGSTLTTGPGSSVVFTGGASKCNVFWQVGSSATLGTTSTVQGTIIALQSITAKTGATINGQALARNGAATLDTNAVDATGCAGVGPVAATNVPTLSAYAIIALMLMLLGIGFAATRKRNV